MLKVIIESAQATPASISNRSGTSASGRPWQIRSQDCWIFKPNSAFPNLFSINLPDEIPFYPAGEYQLDVESLVIPNDFKSLSFPRGAIHLVPFSSESVDQKKSDFSKFTKPVA